MNRLTISENGRYFVREDGTVFPWLADTVWTMPQRLKWDDVEYYMKKRKSQGFTVLQIVALDPERDVEMRNPAGIPALINNCLETPNEDYFRYLDWILDRAEYYGFYVLLLPVWGQLVVGDNWKGERFPKTVTKNNAKGYGRWIGERYRNRSNIIWCLGGDRQPIHRSVDYRDVWRAMAEGLAKGVTGKDLAYDEPDPAWKEVLITYHTCYEMETGECSTMSYWDDSEAWISFLMLQSGHTVSPKNYEMVEKEYKRYPEKPVWDGEPAYEMMPTAWPLADSFHGAGMVRKRAYWSLFAGAFGFTYGHASVWCMVGEKDRNQMYRCTWYEALQSEGSGQMHYLREFMEALHIPSCIPAQEILTEQQKREDVLDTHVQACRDSEGKFVCVYFPQGGTEELKLSEPGWETPRCWWYRPADGEFYNPQGERTEEAFSPEGKVGAWKVAAPGTENDWILIAMKEKTEKPVKHKVYFEFQERTEAGKVFQWETSESEK